MTEDTPQRDYTLLEVSMACAGSCEPERQGIFAPFTRNFHPLTHGGVSYSERFGYLFASFALKSGQSRNYYTISQKIGAPCMIFEVIAALKVSCSLIAH
jgi:hypothetical protein